MMLNVIGVRWMAESGAQLERSGAGLEMDVGEVQDKMP